MADALARSQAWSLRVEWPLRERRAEALRALRVTHDVLGAVVVAALAAARGGPTRAVRRPYLRTGWALAARRGPGWAFRCTPCGDEGEGRTALGGRCWGVAGIGMRWAWRGGGLRP